MELNDYMVWFIGMAIATIAILTVGTLAAADLLHAPSSREDNPPQDTPNAPAPNDHVGDDGGLVDALTPLGSSLYAGVLLKAPDEPPEDPARTARPAA